MTKIQVMRDGEAVSPVFEGESPTPENEAFAWLLRHQGQSVSYATTYGGYEIKDISDEVTAS